MYYITRGTVAVLSARSLLLGVVVVVTAAWVNQLVCLMSDC